MQAIPWYQSPVYIGAVVSIVSQVLVLLGLGDKVAPEEIAKYVDAGFQMIALGAAAYAAWKRQRSEIQPLTLTRAGAIGKSGQAGFAQPSLLALLAPFALIGLLFAGCESIGIQTPKTFNERMVAGYKTVEAISNSAGILLDGGKLSAADARNVLQSATTAKEGLDVARSIHDAGDFSSAESRLAAAIAGLTALQAYLASKER